MVESTSEISSYQSVAGSLLDIVLVKRLSGRWPFFFTVVGFLLVGKSGSESRIVHHKHEHHHPLRHDRVCENRDARELDDTVARLCVHVGPAEDAHHEPDEGAARQAVEQASVLLDPSGVSSIRDGPAVRVQEDHLEAV